MPKKAICLALMRTLWIDRTTLVGNSGGPGRSLPQIWVWPCHDTGSSLFDMESTNTGTLPEKKTESSTTREFTVLIAYPLAEGGYARRFEHIFLRELVRLSFLNRGRM